MLALALGILVSSALPHPAAASTQNPEVADTATPWEQPPEACKRSGLEGRCAVLRVPEDPSQPDGRHLSIHLLVLPALDPSRRVQDPLVVLEGGPGASVLAGAPMHASTFGGVRRHRDLVFVEQRGTGDSAALDCGLGTAGLLDEEAVTACRSRQERQADLRFYGTAHAVLDLARAFDALGYRQVNLFGVSYGTRTALELVRRHPDRVRTVTLLGTYPPGRNAVLDAPWILDQSLDRIAGACGDSVECAAAYPDLRASLRRLAEALDEGALESSRLEVASTLRLMLFYPLTTRHVPAVLSAAAAGDLEPMQALSAPTGAAFSAITDGAFLSLLCSEDVARLRPDEIEAVGSGTLLGSSWADALRRGCSGWALADIPEDFHAPLRSEVPILSLTGELDPSMPPSYGEEFAAALPSTRHLTLPEAQHGLLGMRGVLCVVELIQEFVESGSASELDATCLEQLQRPPFAVP